MKSSARTNIFRVAVCCVAFFAFGTGKIFAQVDPNFRVPTAVAGLIRSSLESAIGDSLGNDPFVVQFLTGQTTLGQFWAAFEGDAYNNTLSAAQLNTISTAFLSGNYSAYVGALSTALSASGWTQSSPGIWTRPGLGYTIEWASASEYATFYSAFASLSALGNLSSSGSGSAAENVTQDIFANSIFDKVAPVSATKASSSKEPAANVTTVFGSDAFYSRTNYDGGGSRKVYGTNLAMTWGDQFQFRATVPIYRADFGVSDSLTYGVDLNGKYKVSETFSLGAHANYLINDTDFGNAKAWTAGVYAATVFATSETSKLSLGALLDRVDPQDAESSWLGAFGMNYGFAVGQNSALNPYVIYYRQFDVPALVDKDWYDLGLELQVNLSETWAFKIGAKTSLGQDGVKSNYQAYLGSAWRF